MDELNKIALDNTMLAMLYRNSLVNMSAVAGVPKVMVVVKAQLTQEEHDFLMQILNACKLRADQVEVVNTSEKGVVIETVVSRIGPSYILSFGAGSGTEIFRMENSGGVKFLTAPALFEMMQATGESKLLKRKTWNELKTIFEL